MSGDGAPAAPPRVRPAVAADHAFLVEANRALARETEGHDLEPAVVAAGVAAALADAGHGTYWIAELEGRAAGCLFVTREWSDWRDGRVWWIQSVYVVAAARGRGVYRALHEHVRAAARERGDVVGLRLYVERGNSRAQATYRHLGMVDSSYVVYEEIFPRR